MKKITVLGLGGGALKVINHIYENKPENVELVYVNTDKQILEKANTKQLLIGQEVTNGLGCAGNSDKGKRAAEYSEEDIKAVIKDSDLLLLIACFGGGTGTGGSIAAAQISKEMGIKTYALITYPFSFEGKKRNLQAINGYREILPLVEEVFALHNDNLLSQMDRSTSLADAFRINDKILAEKFFEIYRDEMRKGE